MKKLLSILGVLGLTATTSATVVACGESNNKLVSDNETFEKGTIEDYEFAYNNWMKIKNKYIREFINTDYLIAIPQKTFEKNYDELKNSINIQRKVLELFMSKLRVWSFLDDKTNFEYNDFDFNYTEFEKDNFVKNQIKFSLELNYKGSKETFVIKGKIAVRDYDPKIVISEDVINEIFKNASESFNQINFNGYFMTLLFIGEKDEKLNWISEQKVLISEIERKAMDYLSGYLKAMNIIGLDLYPDAKNFVIHSADKIVSNDAGTNNKPYIKEGYIYFPKDYDFKNSSIVSKIDFEWINDKSAVFSITGSYLQKGQNY